MPWSNNSGGGGWKGGGGGPWGSGPTPRGPQPPDLEELLRRSQDRLRGALPAGGRGNFAIGAIILAVLLALWLVQAVYTVQADELGQELVFGRPKAEVSEPGLHFHFWPVETVEKVSIRQRRDTIGSNAGAGRGGESGLMLSSDQNIVDVVFSVIWRVSDPQQYLFNVRDPELYVRRIAESAMREYVGRSRAEDVRTERRAEVEEAVRNLVQGTVDAYRAGITIVGIQLERADPPGEVADAFEEVQRAQQDLDRFQREAEAYANRRLGEARGQASQVREAAAGYRDQVVAQADGESQRFVSVYGEYAGAPEITRKRLFLETMENVLRNSNKVILEGDAGQGVVPYLPLDQLQRRSAPAAAQPQQQGGATTQQGGSQ